MAPPYPHGVSTPPPPDRTPPVRMSSLSKEYVKVPVVATVDGAVVNPTTDAVSMAFPASGASPVAADWKTATWETTGTTYLARCLVGPGGTIALDAGSYGVWIKVTDNPEVPVQRAGRLVVT